MFKRMQSADKKLAKRQKNGEVAEDGEGPRELVLDEDSSSSDSSSSSNSSGSDSDSDDDSASETEAKTKNGKIQSSTNSAQNNGKKRAREDDESDDDSDSDDSDSDDSDDRDDRDGKQVDRPLDPLLRPSIEKALSDTIYIKPDAITKEGFQHRSCYICPVALLKTEKMVTTHLASGSHGRRLKRFNAAIAKLSDDEKRDPAQGGLDAPALVERVDKVVQKKQEKQAKHQALIKQQKKEKKHRTMAQKVERRKIRKAAKLEKKERLLQLKEERKLFPERFPKKERKPKQKADAAATGENGELLGPPKQKVIPKRHRVMPSKEERKAHKKVKKAERASRKAAERRAKRAAADATAEGGAAVQTTA